MLLRKINFLSLKKLGCTNWTFRHWWQTTEIPVFKQVHQGCGKNSLVQWWSLILSFCQNKHIILCTKQLCSALHPNAAPLDFLTKYPFYFNVISQYMSESMCQKHQLKHRNDKNNKRCSFNTPPYSQVWLCEISESQHDKHVWRDVFFCVSRGQRARWLYCQLHLWAERTSEKQYLKWSSRWKRHRWHGPLTGSLQFGPGSHPVIQR